MKHKKYALIFLIPFLFVCSQDKGGLFEDDLIALSYGESPPSGGVRVLTHKRIDLDGLPGMEMVAVFAYGNVEELVLFRREGSSWAKAMEHTFSLPESLFATLSPDSGRGFRIIRRLFLRPLGKAMRHNSVIVDYRHEEGDELAVFTNFRLSFDSRKALAKHPLARKEGEERYRFKADNELVLFPESEEFRAHLRYNGHEAVFWYPGLPFLYFGPAERLPGEACRYKLTLWNMGDMAWVSYVTLSFPGSESVSVGNVAGGRMYRRGAKIYHMPSRSYRPASDPMYEITKKSWKSRHRMEVEFGCPLGGLALVRVAIRHMGEARLSPAAELSAPVRLDQQGYPAYVYRLEK